MSAFGPVEEHKPVEEQLRESELRTHAFWDNSPNSIFVKDTELRYLHVNREFEELSALIANRFVARGIAIYSRPNRQLPLKPTTLRC